MKTRLVAITIAVFVLIALVVVINYTYVRPHPLHYAPSLEALSRIVSGY